VRESVGVTFWLIFKQGGAFDVGGTLVISSRDSSWISWNMALRFENHIGIGRFMFLKIFR
jgi:hypothetical protein